MSGIPKRSRPVAVLRLPHNRVGRDFAVGDIHGAFDSLNAALRIVDFDAAVDRLICCGDLVDRGIRSGEALELLQRPGVFSVRGNHDDALLELSHYSQARALAQIDPHNYGWLAVIGLERFLSLQDEFQRLPYAIEIAGPTTDALPVGFVHADVPFRWTWRQFTTALESDADLAREYALHSRERFETRDESGVEGVKRLFVGHNVVQHGPTALGNVLYVDCGAVLYEQGRSRRSALCCMNINEPAEALLAPNRTFLDGFPAYALDSASKGRQLKPKERFGEIIEITERWWLNRREREREAA